MKAKNRYTNGSNALADLVRATPKRYSHYAKLIEAGKPTGSSYYFPGLIAYQREERRAILLDEDEGSVCIYRWQLEEDKPRLDIYLAPNPMNPSVLKRCIERANDFNGDYSARILRVDESDAEAVAAIGFNLKERRQQFLLDPRKYQDLGGSSLRTIRRNVTSVEEISNIEVRQYRKKDAPACNDLLNRWAKAHRKKQVTSGGLGYARRMITVASQLPDEVVTGQVVTIDDKLVGYSFGGAIHSGLACYYETKCEPDIKGLTYFVRRQFLLQMSQYPLVNDGSDGGRAGLNQIKQSFRPVAMHQEYRGYQQSNDG